jgi:hypothetical protein
MPPQVYNIVTVRNTKEIKTMKKLYFTNAQRENAINEITKQIDIMLSLTSESMGYIECRRIVDSLAQLREVIKAEMEENKQ